MRQVLGAMKKNYVSRNGHGNPNNNERSPVIPTFLWNTKYESVLSCLELERNWVGEGEGEGGGG